MDKTKIVFVCLGNYCRSPMAEAIFVALARQDGGLDQFEVSSAGTRDWDIGLRPDSRAQQLLAEHGYALAADKRARQISDQEIESADFLIAVSRQVANELGNGSNVHLLLDFVDEVRHKDIPDPYPTDTFPEAFELIQTGVKAFYLHLKIQKKDAG